MTPNRNWKTYEFGSEKLCVKDAARCAFRRKHSRIEGAAGTITGYARLDIYQTCKLESAHNERFSESQACEEKWTA